MACQSIQNENSVNSITGEIKMYKIAVLGAGTWGIALAKLLAQNEHEVMVWSALPAEIEELRKTGVHPKLPNVELPSCLQYTSNIDEACLYGEIIVMAVPSLYVRETTNKMLEYIKPNHIIVDVAKGIEKKTLFTMTQVMRSELATKAGLESVELVALSGPTHAEEVIRNMPTTIVSACSNIEIAKIIQDVFSNEYMRVYTNPDALGVELCGALKNIIALASGISHGLGYGDNTSATIITRGMAEITRLGLEMGCAEQTFYGLAGIGDLIVTATSLHSRNFKCGTLIGKGEDPDEAVKKIGMVVEGINVLPAAMELKEKYGVEMPISEGVAQIINEKADPRIIAQKLMVRDKKDEHGKNPLLVQFDEGFKG